MADRAYYKLMTVVYVRITGLLMYMYLKIVSTLTTKLCKNRCDRTNALVQNATIENTVNLPTLYHCEVHKNYASVSYLYTTMQHNRI